MPIGRTDPAFGCGNNPFLAIHHRNLPPDREFAEVG